LSVVHGSRLATYDLSPGAKGDGLLATMPDVAMAAASSDDVLVAAGTDGEIGFYDPRTLEPSGPALAESSGHVEQLAFADGGGLMATRTATGELRTIDARARVSLGEPIPIGLDRTHAVAIRPDARELAVMTDDGIRVWDLRPRHWAHAVCSMVGRSLTKEEWSTFLGEVGPYDPSCR
jgi:hypothetical protein